MNKEMEVKFEFSGDWVTKLILDKFSMLNNKDYQRRDQDVNKGIFSMTIEDEQNCNPIPEKEQLNSINYIIQNQDLLLNRIFEYSLESIYPKYKEFQDPEEYPECYPSLTNQNDLQKLLGINEILITRYKKDNFAYSVIGFNTCLDYEHGLYIVFHKDRPITNAPMGDLSYDKIFEEGGNAKYEESYGEYGVTPNEYGFYVPDPKFGKLKPWQRQITERKIEEIINNDPELIKRLTSNKVIKSNSKLCYNTTFELCVKNRKFELVEYFIENGSGFDNSLLFSVGKRFDEELLEFLIKLGAKINKPIYKNKSSTILFKEIYDLAQLFFHNKENKEESIRRIGIILQLGGDLNNCDGKGSSYSELLKSHYSESFIARMGLEEIFSKL